MRRIPSDFRRYAAAKSQSQSMDYSMQNAPSIAPSHSRKRSVRDFEEDDESERNAYAALNIQDNKPLKRLQNSQGYAIKRQPLKYNAHKLLSHLAFTRFYVTANFGSYNPGVSPVVLCMVSEQNELYRAVW